MKIRAGFKLSLMALGILIMVWSASAFSQGEKEDSDELALSAANAFYLFQDLTLLVDIGDKTNLSSEGELKATILNEMRFNTEGELESTNIGGESYVEKKRGLRGRMQQSKMEDFAEYLQSVLDQSFKYIFMSKGTLVDVFDRGDIKHTKDSIDIRGKNIFIKADSLYMSLDPDTKLASMLSFSTMLGEDRINGQVKMKRIEDGPNRPIQLEIDVPGKAINITSETYDWIEQK